MNLKKKTISFVGWMLLFAGLGIIAWSLWQSFNIFTGKINPPDVFEVTENNTKNLNLPPNQKLLEKILLNQIPIQELSVKTFNLIAWSIFVGILIFGGAKISQLGIQLLK